jgi:hypothetical protein
LAALLLITKKRRSFAGLNASTKWLYQSRHLRRKCACKQVGYKKMLNQKYLGTFKLPYLYGLLSYHLLKPIGLKTAAENSQILILVTP